MLREKTGRAREHTRPALRVHQLRADERDRIAPVGVAGRTQRASLEHTGRARRQAYDSAMGVLLIMKSISKSRSLFEPFDLSPDGAQLLFDFLVAAIEVVHAIDNGDAVGDEPCKYKRRACAKV